MTLRNISATTLNKLAPSCSACTNALSAWRAAGTRGKGARDFETALVPVGKILRQLVGVSIQIDEAQDLHCLPDRFVTLAPV